MLWTTSTTPAVLGALGRVFGSLAWSDVASRRIIAALERDPAALASIVDDAAAEAVPDVGWPHPQRAEAEDCPCGVDIVTPGGVRIAIRPDGVIVSFGRVSEGAASDLASELETAGVPWDATL